MDLFDLAAAPLRFVLGNAEGAAQQQPGPVHEVVQLQAHVLHAAEAVREASEQIEAQVQTLDRLVDSLSPLVETTLPALTAAVQQLCVELTAVKPLADGVRELQAPLEPLTTLPALTEAVAAIREPLMALPPLTSSVAELSSKLDVVAEVLTPMAEAEQDLSRVGHFFARKKQQDG